MIKSLIYETIYRPSSRLPEIRLCDKIHTRTSQFASIPFYRTTAQITARVCVCMCPRVSQCVPYRARTAGKFTFRIFDRHRKQSVGFRAIFEPGVGEIVRKLNMYDAAINLSMACTSHAALNVPAAANRYCAQHPELGALAVQLRHRARGTHRLGRLGASRMVGRPRMSGFLFFSFVNSAASCIAGRHRAQVELLESGLRTNPHNHNSCRLSGSEEICRLCARGVKTVLLVRLLLASDYAVYAVFADHRMCVFGELNLLHWKGTIHKLSYIVDRH